MAIMLLVYTSIQRAAVTWGYVAHELAFPTYASVDLAQGALIMTLFGALCG